VGGLDWEQVYPLIKQHLSKLETPVYLYTTFRKNVKALEPAYNSAR
jgi:hypothetical protein